MLVAFAGIAAKPTSFFSTPEAAEAGLAQILKDVTGSTVGASSWRPAPSFNTVVVSLVIAVIAGFVPAEYLWDTVSIGPLVAFSTVAIGIIVMRRTHPDLERPFKVPGYPVTPILTVAACLYIMWASPRSRGSSSSRGLLLPSRSTSPLAAATPS